MLFQRCCEEPGPQGSRGTPAVASLLLWRATSPLHTSVPKVLLEESHPLGIIKFGHGGTGRMCCSSFILLFWHLSGELHAGPRNRIAVGMSKHTLPSRRPQANPCRTRKTQVKATTVRGVNREAGHSYKNAVFTLTSDLFCPGCLFSLHSPQPV